MNVSAVYLGVIVNISHSNKFVYQKSSQDFVMFSVRSKGNILKKRLNNIWDKALKNGPSKICKKQPLKILK